MLEATGESWGPGGSNPSFRAPSGIGIGVANDGTIGTLNNSGTIWGRGDVNSSSGIRNNDYIGTLNNSSSGTVIGELVGILNSSGSTGTIGSLVNSGKIIGLGYGYGIVLNSGLITSLTNNSSGLISGATGISNGGTIATLTNGGTIDGSNVGIFNVGGTIGTLVNSGIIRGTDSDNGMGFISYESVGTLNNARSGTITGGITGVAISGYVGTLTNSGNISGTISSGITNDGTIGTLNNSGNITGGAAGIGNSGTIGTLINSGTISGSAMYAIGNEGTLGVIANSGVIAGNIANLTSQNLTINGDTSGAVGAFGTLTGYTDGAIGGIGKITNIDANVVFGAGNLVLNDSINVGAHAVNNTGATLKVNAPMTITGNYNQGAAATLLIGVSAGASAKGLMADTGYGRLVVSGSALISPGATVALSSQSYAFAPGQRFVVVDAASAGTNYNEGTLTYSIRGYKSVLTGANVTAGGRSDLVVTVVSATPFPPPPTPPVITPETPPAPPRAGATTPNAIAALAGLAKYTGISDPALLNLFNAGQALNLGSTASANRAGAQLNPSSPGAISQAVSAPTFSVLNIIAGRSDGMRLAGADGGSGVSTGEAPPAWGVWGQAFGGRASQGEHDMIDGYSANFAGFLIGADRAINDAWRAGGVFSYSNTTIDSTGNTAGNRTRVNAFGLVGYASYIASAWYANLSAGVVQQRYDTSRTIDFTGFSGSANGRFNGTQYVVRAEAGYPLALRFATVTPIASLTYSYLHQSAYTESGGNGAALAVDAAHTTSVTSDFGVKISREFPTVHGTLVPELQVGWRHQYDNSRNATNARFVADPTGAAAFTSLSAHPVSDLAVVQAGLTLLRANNLSVTARYELQVGGGLVSQAGTLRLRQLF